MKQEFVPYELALKIKELGFDEPCFGFYYDDGELQIKEGNHSPLGYLNSPTFSQAFRWFRENHQWTIKVNQVTKNNWSYTLENFPNDRTYYGEVYKSFEVAEIGCLEKLISFIEREK